MGKSLLNSQKIISEMDASQRIIIYCMGVEGKPIKDKVDIQKIIFLSAMSLPDIFENMYTFQKHKKGPYSEKIDEDVAVISNSGYVGGSQFGLSDSGYELFNDIEARIKDPLKSTLLENKEFVSDLTDDELLTFIYIMFPQYTENSEVWEKLKQYRVKNAVSMLKKEKITSSLAAVIAGYNYYDFEKYLMEQKIRWKS
ncbi:MAG: hypothetical protein M0P07_06030 [Candidatus Methanomethylophilaceae archaeon]|nr:hypothetical protein [Candidatus Methanomethylophilaceae archaeon]